MAKLVKITDNKAIRIEGIQIGDNQMISVRKMYQTKKEPGVWKPGQGMTIDLEVAARVGKHIINLAAEDGADFKVIELEEKSSTTRKAPAKKVPAKKATTRPVQKKSARSKKTKYQL
jgi:hypothetical protein